MAAHKGHVKAGGRQKGTPNKLTTSLREMILGALDDAGGQEYLKRQATENPNAFLSLLGKVLPLNIEGNVVHNYVIMGEPEAPTIDAWQQQHHSVQ